ncbi:RNA-directed DNA polymerase, eukaryota [Tanacetum coccineum]
MGTFRSKEDDVAKISISVFVTNFPDSISSKDLFNACKQYGHVVDSFIATKRSKAGKRFGFVRFINVFSVDRLVNNLCTVWINRHKLHANVARFSRVSEKNPNKTFVSSKPVGASSYAATLKERIVWVDIEGVPLRAWSQSTFKKIGAKWGEVMRLEENKEDMFARKRICIKTSREDNILERFKITVRAQAVDDNPSPVPNAINKRSKTGGSILDLLDELIKVGNTMGYSLDGCAKDLENIIGLQGECDVSI